MVEKTAWEKRKEKLMKKSQIDLAKLSKQLIIDLSQKKRLVKIPKRKRFVEGKLKESACLTLSDVHVGKTNMIMDYETGKPVLTYNYDIMVKQANRLIESIADVNELLSKTYEINKLYIFGLGDLIDGDIVYRGQRFYIEEGVGRQMLVATKLFTDMTLELLKLFDEIDFTVVAGNHGRMDKRFMSDPPYNNFDFLMGKMLELVFKDEPRVNIVVPESRFFMRTIHKWKYHLHHGATVRSWMGLPYYGIVRQSKQRRAEMSFDMELIGHFHTQMEIPISGRAYTLVNGCWIDKDSFGWNQYGKLSRPEQRYFGISKKRPRTWEFNLDLTTKKFK